MSGLVGFAGTLYEWNGGGTGGALDLRDTPFSGAEDLGNPNRTAWAQATRNYLNSHPDVNVIIWSWCGQVSSASEADINTYLNLMSALEADYPNVRFVYMTGHQDGGGLTGNLHLRNEQIRTYCRANGKVLYDFADIEVWNPDGLYFGDKTPNDACDYDSDGDGSLDGNWAIEWQNTHTEGVDWYQCSSAHSQPLNANLKAYAAWALWARLAGWMGGAGDTVAMATRTLVVREDQPEATLTVTRSGELAAGVTVDYATNDGLGTAIAGEDYVSTSGRLTFADGEASKTISVPLIDDVLEDDGETFHVELTAVGGTDAELGVPTSTAVTIEDDDTVDAWI